MTAQGVLTRGAPGKRRRKSVIILVSLLVVTALHYSTAISRVPLHSVYRELYMIPVVLSGLWFGKRWGLGTAVAASLAYLPHMVQVIGFQSEMAPEMPSMFWDSVWVNGIQLVLFHAAGLSAGAYRDTKRGFQVRLRKPAPVAESGRDVLLFLDETPASLEAVRYTAEVFTTRPGQRITLLWVSAQQDAEFFENEEEAEASDRREVKKAEESLSVATTLLLDAGVPADSLSERSFRVEKRSRVSDRILQELESGDYHTVVLGKHRLSKAEEFLFGSKTIRLVREAGVNVVAVKAPLETDPTGG